MQARQTLLTDLDQLRLRAWLENLPSPRERRSRDLSMLRRKVRGAGVVGQREIPRDVVTMNSLVRVRDLTHNARLTCTLVYPDDADRTHRKVSVAAPMGTELLGRRVGETFDCGAPDGSRQMRIESVFYQPEAAGDFHL